MKQKLKTTKDPDVLSRRVTKHRKAYITVATRRREFLLALREEQARRGNVDLIVTRLLGESVMQAPEKPPEVKPEAAAPVNTVEAKKPEDPAAQMRRWAAEDYSRTLAICRAQAEAMRRKQEVEEYDDSPLTRGLRVAKSKC